MQSINNKDKMNFLAQKGLSLYCEAIQTNSFGSKEKDLEKLYKTKYLLDSWKYGINSELILKCYVKTYNEYLEKIKEQDCKKQAINDAIMQAKQPSVAANIDYYDNLEKEKYQMKKMKSYINSKKRKSSFHLNNINKKRRKPNLTINTNV